MTPRRGAGRAAAALLAAAAWACGPRGGVGVYEARGVVEDVNREYAQVVIAHEDIPGLMPAMTMNFEVPDAVLLERLAPGQAIDFRLEFTGRSYRVIEATVRGAGAATSGAPALAGVAALGAPAPGFRLVDQDGRPVELEGLRGRLVVLDFIYTQCPGPCPIQTGIHVELLRSLDERLRSRVWLVSISLDPEHDTPQAMRAYAKARGADLARWSFLTGPPAEVARVLEDYGVGSARQTDGTIAHLLVTFVIDGEGRIARRYVGAEHGPAALRRDLEQLAAEGPPPLRDGA